MQDQEFIKLYIPILVVASVIKIGCIFISVIYWRYYCYVEYVILTIGLCLIQDRQLIKSLS